MKRERYKTFSFLISNATIFKIKVLMNKKPTKDQLVKQYKIKLLTKKLEEATGKKVTFKRLKEAPLPPNYKGKSVYQEYVSTFDTQILVSFDIESLVNKLLNGYGYKNINRVVEKLGDLLNIHSLRSSWERYEMDYGDEERDEDDLLWDFLIEEGLRDGEKVHVDDAPVNCSEGLREMQEDFNESHLEKYFDSFSGITKIVGKIVNNQSILRVQVFSKGELNDQQLSQVKDYLVGQFSDGWGEGFEQQDFYKDGVRYNLHTWASGGRGKGSSTLTRLVQKNEPQN